jgi:hypothetical protein
VRTELAEIIDLTERVQAALDAGDWLRAGEIDAERRRRLERLVVERAELATDAIASDALAAVQRRTFEMIGQVHHHRRRVLREASTLRTGQAAVDSYGERSRDER